MKKYEAYNSKKEGLSKIGRVSYIKLLSKISNGF